MSAAPPPKGVEKNKKAHLKCRATQAKLAAKADGGKEGSSSPPPLSALGPIKPRTDRQAAGPSTQAERSDPARPPGQVVIYPRGYPIRQTGLLAKSRELAQAASAAQVWPFAHAAPQLARSMPPLAGSWPPPPQLPQLPGANPLPYRPAPQYNASANPTPGQKLGLETLRSRIFSPLFLKLLTETSDPAERIALFNLAIARYQRLQEIDQEMVTCFTELVQEHDREVAELNQQRQNATGGGGPAGTGAAPGAGVSPGTGGGRGSGGGLPNVLVLAKGRGRGRGAGGGRPGS
jgi:hypothetical protein